MKQKKFFLFAVCLLSALNINAVVYEGSCGANGDNVKYSLDTETGVLVITGAGEMGDYNFNSSSDFYVPWYNERTYIKTVEISEGVTSIGSTAFFGCSSLTSITIPNSVTSIRVSAFTSCSNLSSITIPNSVIEIGEDAFTLCTSLTSIIIPNSVKSIGVEAFQACTGLTSITIPNSVTTIGYGAFDRCSNLTQVTLNSNAIEYSVMWIFGKQVKKYILGNNITSIKNGAFSSCSGLTEVIIPNSVTSIGSSAFSGCSGLTSVTIPNSVTSIGSSAFLGCSSLEELFYLSKTPPTNWVATKNTYVPDAKTYSSPSESINGNGIIPMITFESSSFNYTGASPELKWQNNVVGYDAVLSFSNENKNAGKYETWIPATFTKGEVSFSTNVMCRYTIKPAPLTAKATNVSREYGEKNPQFNISYSGFVNGENESVISTKPTISTTATKTSSVGNYLIRISGGEAINYDFVYEQGVLTVTKVSLSAKVKDATKVYGSPNPSFSIEYYGLKNGETSPTWSTRPTFMTEATNASGVGQYIIRAVDGVAVNYDMEIADGMLMITQAPLTVKANNTNRKYFEDEPTFDYSCTGFLNNDDEQVLTKKPIIVTEATKTSNVGTYKITPSGAEAKNYAISYEQGELTITKQQLKATSHCSRFYGDENPILPIEYTGFVNGETEEVLTVKPLGITNATKTSSVGNYLIRISGGEAINYDFVYEQGVLTVTKVSLSAKVKDATKVYGSPNPSFSIEYYGLKNGETSPTWSTRPTFMTEATNASRVGQYAIKAVNGTPVNYDLDEITDGTLDITPAPLTIKANDVSRQYYSENPTLIYTCSGFMNGDDKSTLSPAPMLSTSAELSSEVGIYGINVANAGNPNYTISYVNGTLTITPRTLIASVGNYERIYNEENPAFEIKYDGFVGNDDEKVLNMKAIASTTATKTSDVGSYIINVSGGSADNYKFSYTSGTLTINKAEQYIIWKQDLSRLHVGDQIKLTAEASSGLPVTYQMENSRIADIYSAGKGYYIDCIFEGEAQIVAIQEGNSNYYASPRKRKNIVIDNSVVALRGDVNGDGNVNGTDIQAIINLIVESQYDEKADVNSDGTVNGTDIQEVINIIVGE